MKKRILAASLIAVCLATFTACQYAVMVPILTFFMASMGTYYETGPDTYQDSVEYIDHPAFFPEAIDEYTVNDYSYTRYEYMDTCVELFVDLTVTETQMTDLINLALSAEGVLAHRDAYYAEGYKEIVFSDYYRINDEVERVGNADVQKVIYNLETGNVIYEYFDAFDSGVYELKDVAYFNRFGIDQQEYKTYTIENNE